MAGDDEPEVVVEVDCDRGAEALEGGVDVLQLVEQVHVLGGPCVVDPREDSGASLEYPLSLGVVKDPGEEPFVHEEAQQRRDVGPGGARNHLGARRCRSPQGRAVSVPVRLAHPSASSPSVCRARAAARYACWPWLDSSHRRAASVAGDFAAVIAAFAPGDCIAAMAACMDGDSATVLSSWSCAMAG